MKVLQAALEHESEEEPVLATRNRDGNEGTAWVP